MEEVIGFRKLSPPSYSSTALKLTSANNNFTYRIVDPKRRASPPQLNDENDVFLRTMLSQVPQVSRHFNVIEKLGEGTFSKVYRGRLKPFYTDATLSETEQQQEYALKYIIPIVKPARVLQEIRFLRNLGGASNIIDLKDCFLENGHTVVVMPIVEHDKFFDFFQKMDIAEVREFLRNLFIALERVHMHNIIHRDIKPSNFLYNRRTKQYALVDFGLSQSAKDLYRANCRATLSKLDTRAVGLDSKARKLLDFNDAVAGKPKEEGHTNKTIEADGLGMKRCMDEADGLGMKRCMDEADQPETRDLPLFKRMCVQQENISVMQYKPSNAEVNRRLQFIEQSSSSVFDTPTKTPTINSRVLCHSPVEEWLRIPLAEDMNRVNVELQQNLVTPNKETGNGTFQLVTPIKVNTQTTIQPTPPRNVARQFEFTSATKDKTVTVTKLHQKKIQIPLQQLHQFRTPVTITRTSLNNRQAAVEKNVVPPSPALARLPNSNKNTETPKTEDKYKLERNSKSSVCQCAKSSRICAICLRKPELNVPRAGTPGFRAPEILLRSPNQTTKIDIWSSGVIMACILSGRYPFFRALDDLTCLAEIIAILGSSKVKQAAKVIGKTLVTSHSLPAMDLKDLCVSLRKSLIECVKEGEVVQLDAPDSAYDLLSHLLDPNPFDRYSASEALGHPFFRETSES